MAADVSEPHVYHISLWRYLWVWFVFGPIGLFLLGAAAFSPASPESVGLLVGGVCFLLVPLFITLLVRLSRLEVSEKGVLLKQIGYRLEAPWSDIIALRLDRGHESFITSQPVGGKGAGLLAAAGSTGMSFYDAGQQALLDEHRLIPIEAFARHLRHGKLRAQIAHFAPHLQDCLAALDTPVGSPHPSASRPPARSWTIRDWTVLTLIIAFVAGIFLFAVSSKQNGVVMEHAAGALFAAAFAVRAAIGARNCLRRRSWLIGSGLALLSALLALWSFTIASSLAETLGAGRASTQVFVTLLFAIVALGMAFAARHAFRRRSWVLGAVFLLLAAFLVLCTIMGVLDFAKPH